jgi:hypothetical protein
MTLALALFYVMALVLYYSTPRVVYHETPRIPVLAQAPAYTATETASDAPSTVFFVFSPDFTVGLLTCLKLIVAISVALHLAVFLHESGRAAAQRRRSRDPPLLVA